MPAVELDQAMRADFEAWSVSAGFAYRNHQGFWFYRNGGDGMFEAYCAGAVSQRKGLEDNPCHCQKPPNVAGNRLAEGKSGLTGLLGGPTRSEKE